MTHSVDAIFVFQMASALFYVLLGAWVLTLTPRRRQTTLLGVFAVLYGLGFLVVDVAQLLDYVTEVVPLEASVIVSLLLGGASLAVLALAWTVVQPLEGRRLLGIALVAGVLWSFLEMAALHFVQNPQPGPGTPRFWLAVGAFARKAFLGAAVFLLILRAHPARRPGRDRVVQLALLSVALATLSAFFRGTAIVDAAGMLAQGQVVGVLVTLANTGVGLVLAGLWGWNMLRADDETVGVHRAGMLGILGLLAVGAFYRLAFQESSIYILGRGLMRTLGVGLLAYGVLRHDLAGLDEKVEFGVSRTTVAGVFVAVFFVVSEGAQVLLAGFANSEILGVLAAGALVFAISPLQRLADRFAAKAVPGGAATGGARAEATYRRTVERYLADGTLTAEEGHELGELAAELGIDPERARELREQAQAEAEAEGGEAT